MTRTMSRAIGISTALIAGCLGALLLIAANQASAGDGPGPRCSGKKATVNGLTGTNGNDVIVGTTAADEIDGGAGKDLICGRGGDDDILGGTGGDTVHGGSRADFINGEEGDDKLFGSTGDDGCNRSGLARGVCNGKARGIDDAGLLGGEGDDLLGGGAGDDELAGQGGTDTHNGAAGFDGCFDGGPDSEFNSCEYGP